MFFSNKEICFFCSIFFDLTLPFLNHKNVFMENQKIQPNVVFDWHWKRENKITGTTGEGCLISHAFSQKQICFQKTFLTLSVSIFQNFFSHSILHILDSREYSCLTCLMKKKKKQTLSKWGFDFSEFYLHLVPSTFFFFFSFLFKKTSPKSREGTFLFLMVDFFFVTTL